MVVASACGQSPPPTASPPPLAPATPLQAPPETSAPHVTPVTTIPQPSAATTRWMLVAGGADPASTELQIETDALAAGAFFEKSQPSAGIQLFAGGPRAFGVHERPPETPGSDIPLREVIGAIFGQMSPPGRFRPHRVPAHGAASEEVVVTTLESLATTPGPTLNLWLSGHGESTGPTDSAFSLWGGAFLTPTMVAEIWSDARRSLRVIAATCHSGAWTELVFATPGSSDPFGSVGGPVRCALTATTWDRVASGCDPDPERKASESWARLLVEGMAGVTVDGQSIPKAARDPDGDGVTTLLEAHMRAVVVSRGFDVPTTSTGRWLAHVAGCTDSWDACGDSTGAASVVVAPASTWPEVDAAIDGLVARLGIINAADLAVQVRTRVAELAAIRGSRLESLNLCLADEDVRAAGLRGALLGRWPVINDAWHPVFDSTLATESDAIVAFLSQDNTYSAWQQAVDASLSAQERLDDVELELAPWLRLQMLLKQRELATSLMAREPSDDARRRFESLLACERGTP